MGHGIEYLVASATAALADLPVRARAGTRADVPGYGPDAASDVTTYRLWIDAHAPARAAARQAVLAELLRTPTATTISVLVPIYRPSWPGLESCIRSVMTQTYGNWQLIACIDGEIDPGVRRNLEALIAGEPRIVLSELPTNQGISAATNHAASLASGDYLAFMDQDDVLETGALGDVALAIVRNPRAVVVYTDQDKIDERGDRSEPYFKPDWAPDLLTSNMYLGHLLTVAATRFREVGGLRSEYDGSQDYDLALRLADDIDPACVVHVPVVAYHWRTGEGSTAGDYTAKPVADAAAVAALTDAMVRRGEAATVEPGLWEGTFRVRRRVRGRPSVEVVIPFHDGADMLQRVVDSLHATAGYDNWHATLVDNRSWEPETRAVLRRLQDDPKLTLTTYDAPFNWSAINNFVAKSNPADHYLFLNSDIEGRTVGWMEAMVEHSQRPEVGAVGARLLYPEGLVQHAGVVMGLGGGVAWHAFCFCPEDQPGYQAHAKLIRNYTAVTGACMMVRAEVFDAVDGFDETLDVAYNDVDFCLRLRERGYLVVYTPFAELLHYEGATRGKGALEHDETALMMKRWGHIVRGDPYFNPNLSPLRSECQLAVDTEESDPWAHLE